MTITRIEPAGRGKTKYRVYGDGEFLFLLYKGEIARYRIQEGAVLEEDILKKLRGVAALRAKRRAMHLLEDMDRTRKELERKLSEGGCPKWAVEEALAYVSAFGYLDDAAYGERFVERWKEKKSRREIEAMLLKKGLSREQTKNALEAYCGEEDSLTAIRGILEKKGYKKETADPQETQRLCAYLARKGFRYEDIRQVIQVSEWDA